MIAEATRASADRARGIVLSGTAGVGKTRVAREAVASCGPRSARRHWIIGTDAAAQAVIAYQHAGLRGASTEQPFTTRQREIISLAAQGLSNKEIADRLTVSIRSVEGHLFRASQRVRANNREQLISIMRGS